MRRTSQMNLIFPDVLVTHWESLVPGITEISDKDDRHIVAAAIKGQASAIITNNIQDFPDDALASYGLHAVTCDDFLLDLDDLFETEMDESLCTMKAQRTNPPLTFEQLMRSLQNVAPRFSTSVAQRYGIALNNTGGSSI